MVSRGKKSNDRGASGHSRGGHQSTIPTSTRNSSPAKSPKKNLPPKGSPQTKNRTWNKRPTKQKFGCGDTMDSAQKMVDAQRQNERFRSQTQYCGSPPLCQDLVHMRLVIPGDYLVPKRLSDLSLLDDVRRDQQVWIIREEGSETFLDISAIGTTSLHSALNAINLKIHEMRLAEESLTTQYFVQPLLERNKDVGIAFEVGKRPSIEDAKNFPTYPAHAIRGLGVQFADVLPSAFKSLVALECLEMRINFGHLNILTKRKTAGDILPLEEFESALDLYSTRGRGAVIQTEFSNTQVTDAFLSAILHNDKIARKDAEIILQHHVQFVVDKQEVRADLLEEDGIVKATSSRCTEAERHPPLNWIVSSPEMYVDWSLRVDSRPHFIGDKSGQLPETTAKFVQSFVLKTDQNNSHVEEGEVKKANKNSNTPQLFKLPQWRTSNRGELAQSLSNFQVKSRAKLQYLDTPHEIEITVVQHWPTLPARPEPDHLTWSVAVSGIHWEEALSECKTGDSLKVLDENLARMWPGEGPLDERLEELLGCVLAVQTAMGEFVPQMTEDTCATKGD